jgi:dCMP deaminase
MRISWDKYFMEIAKIAAIRSEDPKTKVGCVIVDKDNRVVSMGFNGAAKDIDLSEKIWGSDEKHTFVFHAEMNCVLYSRQNLTDCTLYCTLEPCFECSKLIVASGIKKIFYGESRGDIRTMKLLNASNVISILLT